VQQIITVPTVGSNAGFTATQKYYYDSLNRIDDATETISGSQTWRQDFSYDRFGNRNFVETNTTTLPKNCGTSPNFTVCVPDRKIYNPSINTTNNRLNTTDNYAFDNSGNTKGDAQGRTFIYDSENKQVEVKNSSNATVGQYFYDGDGKRVKKFVPSTGEVTIFVYDAAGKQIAEYSTIVANSTDAKVAYVTNDHLGSPRINTDQNGAIIARHDYMPFGKEIVTPQRTAALNYAADTVRKKFTGYERDDETDLDFAQARYFDSGFGRFSSPDYFANDTHTVDPQSWNLYVYVRNSPLKYIDPTGTDLVFNFQGSTYKVERTRLGGPLQLVDSNGNASEGKELASATTMLNDLDSRGKLNNEIDSLIKTGSHVVDIGFVSGSENPGGNTFPSGTDRQYTRSGVTLNSSSEEMVGESTIALGTEIISANYLADKNDLNAAHAYGKDAKGNQVDQFNNDPESPLPGSTTYQEFRTQSSSDLRRTMGIAPDNAILPPVLRTGSGSGAGFNPPDPNPLPTPPPPPRRPQPSDNTTEIQRRMRRP
jgi:RHS repeat-associated protein